MASEPYKLLINAYPVSKKSHLCQYPALVDLNIGQHVPDPLGDLLPVFVYNGGSPFLDLIHITEHFLKLADQILLKITAFR